jgi:hypothetical protein
MVSKRGFKGVQERLTLYTALGNFTLNYDPSGKRVTELLETLQSERENSWRELWKMAWEDYFGKPISAIPPIPKKIWELPVQKAMFDYHFMPVYICDPTSLEFPKQFSGLVESWKKVPLQYTKQNSLLWIESLPIRGRWVLMEASANLKHSEDVLYQDMSAADWQGQPQLRSQAGADIGHHSFFAIARFFSQRRGCVSVLSVEEWNLVDNLFIARDKGMIRSPDAPSACQLPPTPPRETCKLCINSVSYKGNKTSQSVVLKGANDVLLPRQTSVPEIYPPVPYFVIEL